MTFAFYSAAKFSYKSATGLPVDCNISAKNGNPPIFTGYTPNPWWASVNISLNI